MNSLPCSAEIEPKIWLNFFSALGDCYGAGIAGKGFALSLAKKTDLRLYIDSPPGFDLESEMNSPAEVVLLRELASKPISTEYPSFVRGSIFSRRWSSPRDWPNRTASRSLRFGERAPFVTHVFFEFEHLSRSEIGFLAQSDIVTSGSHWASRMLIEHGMSNVATVHQGVELDIFRLCDPSPIRPPELEGKFLIFSGGKYEYRKGTDLVIAAFAKFRQRHADAVLLINAFNPWPATQSGLSYSPHFHFMPVNVYPDDLGKLLCANGLSADSFQVLGPSTRHDLANAMSYSDCGLFPIRCEGGTNHFLMEYMGCGRPVIATYTSGLTDILRPNENCIALQSFRNVPANIFEPEPSRGSWCEPAIDEIVSSLELLYASREMGTKLARQGSIDIQRFDWSLCTDQLLSVFQSNPNTSQSTEVRFPQVDVPQVLIAADENISELPFMFGRDLGNALQQRQAFQTTYFSADPCLRNHWSSPSSMARVESFERFKRFCEVLHKVSTNFQASSRGCA